MLKRTLLLTVLVLFSLFGVLAFNAATLESRQQAVESPGLMPVDETAAIERFAAALRIPAISHEPPSRPDSAEFFKLHSHIAESYPLVDSLLEKTVVGGASLLLKWPGTDPSLEPGLLMAHMDVVPVEAGTETNWKYPPFSGAVAEDTVWGRGALDNRMNLFSALEALEYLLAEGFQPQRTLYFVSTHDEEVGGQHGSAKICELFQEQGIKLAFVLDEGIPIIKSKAIPGIDKAVGYICIAEKGYANIELSVDSQGGHSSQPAKETAIGILGQALANLQAQPFEATLDGPVAQMFDHLSPEMPFALRLVFGNRWLFEPVIIGQMESSKAASSLLRTTVAPTMLEGSPKANVMPARPRAVVNFRIRPGESVESVVAHVTAAVADERVNVRLMDEEQYYDPIKPASTEGAGYRAIERSIRETFPEIFVAPNLMPAGTDSKHYAPVCDDIYRFSPAWIAEEDLDGIHGTNERLAVGSYLRMVQFYERFVRNACGPDSERAVAVN